MIPYITKTFGLGPQLTHWNIFFSSIVTRSTQACHQKERNTKTITEFRDQIHHQLGQQIWWDAKLVIEFLTQLVPNSVAKSGETLKWSQNFPLDLSPNWLLNMMTNFAPNSSLTLSPKLAIHQINSSQNHSLNLST